MASEFDFEAYATGAYDERYRRTIDILVTCFEVELNKGPQRWDFHFLDQTARHVVIAVTNFVEDLLQVLIPLVDQPELGLSSSERNLIRINRAANGLVHLNGRTWGEILFAARNYSVHQNEWQNFRDNPKPMQTKSIDVLRDAFAPHEEHMFAGLIGHQFVLPLELNRPEVIIRHAVVLVGCFSRALEPRST